MTQAAEAAPLSPFLRGWPVRRVIIPLARLLRIVHRVRVFGAAGIPRDRPVIYVGKHPRSYLYFETIILGLVAFWDSDRPPFRVLEQRDTSLHRAPLLGWIRRHVNALPATTAAARWALDHGESVLVFPGGARELYGPANELRWAGRMGFARLALETGVPVLPFAIVGADAQHAAVLRLGGRSVWLPPFPLPVRMDVHFGAPIPPEGSATSPADVAALAALAEAATRELLRDGLATRRGARSA